jgi:hypothetical protein
MLRGPGCCLGTLVGLAAGVALTAAVLWRWAPKLVEDLLDQAAHPIEARRVTAPVPRATGRDAGAAEAAGPRETTGPRATQAPTADAAGAARRAVALQAGVRERLRRIADDARRGKRIQKPVEFSEAEVRAALADPLGPLPDFPEGVQADLLPGRVRLSWKFVLPGTPRGWEWTRRLGEVEASLDLAPRIEEGRLICPVVAGRVGALPLPGLAARAVAPIAPAAPPLPPREGMLVPAGIGGVDIAEGKLLLVPDPLWKESAH